MESKQLAKASIALAASIALNGCSGSPPVVDNRIPEEPVARTQPSPAARPMSGTPIDTSKYDARVKDVEGRLASNPNDKKLQLELAKAYYDRAEALKGAQQYRSALGDYRRVLKYDPSHEEAKKWIDTIVTILKQMGREVPAEGTEPPPLPYEAPLKT